MQAAHRRRCKMSQICQIYLCPNVIQMQAAQTGRFSFFMVTFLASGNSHLYLGRHNLTRCNHTHSRPHIQTCQNSEPAMQPQTAVIMQCIVEKIFFVENVQMSTGQWDSWDYLSQSTRSSKPVYWISLGRPFHHAMAIFPSAWHSLPIMWITSSPFLSHARGIGFPLNPHSIIGVGE